MMFFPVRVSSALNSSYGTHPFTEAEEREQVDHPLVLCRAGTNWLIPETNSIVTTNSNHNCLFLG